MKKEYDLRKLKRRSGAANPIARLRRFRLAFASMKSVLAALRTEAERLGIPYQTLVGSILHRYVHHELIDPKAVNLDGYGSAPDEVAKWSRRYRIAATLRRPLSPTEAR